MKPLLEYLVKSLVDEPSAVVVEEIPGQATRYVITVAEGDRGRVIGKNGRIANALRTVAKAVGTRHKRRVQVEITTT